MPRLHITPVVLNLLIINGLVFLALNIYPDILFDYLVLQKSDLIISPRLIEYKGEFYQSNFQPIQILTSFFAHREIWHIFMNMFALVSFGSVLETVMGARRFLTAYLVIGIVSSAIDAFLDPDNSPVLGASGALFGMMVLFAYYFPQTRLGLMFIPIRFPVRNFMIGAAVISAGLVVIGLFYADVGFISHFGHLSGMVVGFVYLHLGKLRKVVKK